MFHAIDFQHLVVGNVNISQQSCNLHEIIAIYLFLSYKVLTYVGYI